MTKSLLARAAVLALLAASAACGSANSDGDAPAPPAQAASTSEGAAPVGNMDAQGPRMVVYKTPTCGCCREWVKRAQEAGFQVQVVDTASVEPVKAEHGLPGHLASCHTAVVEGYVIEGHVPPEVVVRLLRERPQGIAGVAVPGMPRGAPGMEVPDGTKDPYDVIAFGKNGKVSVYESR